MEYRIRKATIEDAKDIALCLFLAMKDIAFYIFNTNDEKEALSILEEFISTESNQYSYSICWVVENNNKQVVAASNIYNGADLIYLRNAVLLYNLNKFDRNIEIEDETQPGEYYIDCMGVHPNFQGKGIGSLLFRHLIHEYVDQQKQTLGLLVDLDNPQAKKLYIKLGFEVVGEKTLAGKTLEHMQIKP